MLSPVEAAGAALLALAAVLRLAVWWTAGPSPSAATEACHCTCACAGPQGVVVLPVGAAASASAAVFGAGLALGGLVVANYCGERKSRPLGLREAKRLYDKQA